MPRVAIKRGDRVVTPFCKGNVTHVLDGRKRGWTNRKYYALKVTQPRYAKGTRQIVSEDEVIGVFTRGMIKSYDVRPISGAAG